MALTGAGAIAECENSYSDKLYAHLPLSPASVQTKRFDVCRLGSPQLILRHHRRPNLDELVSRMNVRANFRSREK